MAECLHVEKAFPAQLAGLGWEVIDHGFGIIPWGLAGSQPSRWCELIPLEVFGHAVCGAKLPVNLENQRRQLMQVRHYRPEAPA